MQPIKLCHWYEHVKKRFTYKDVITDCEGWINPDNFLPADFELVFARISNMKRTIKVWHSYLGGWDGYLLPEDKKKYQVMAWKRIIH